MGNKNSTQYQPQQIVDHLRQQYPQLNNEQLMQLYTRLYLRNNKMTPDNIDHATRTHLEQIQQIIYFNNGVAFGLNIGYWKDGKIWFKNHLKNDRFHGLCELYDERGALVESVHYIDGCRVN